MGKVVDLMIETRLDEKDKEGKIILGYKAKDGSPIMSGKNGKVTQHMKTAVADQAYAHAEKHGKGKSKEELEAFAQMLQRVWLSGEEKWYKELMDFQGKDLPYAVSKDKKKFLVNIAFKPSAKLGKPNPKHANDDPFHMMDRKYKISHNALPSAKEVHTSSDFIAHDATIDKMKKGTKVFFYLQGGKDGFASDLRLGKAHKKLLDAGIESKIVNLDKMSKKDRDRLEL